AIGVVTGLAATEPFTTPPGHQDGAHGSPGWRERSRSDFGGRGPTRRRARYWRGPICPTSGLARPSDTPPEGDPGPPRRRQGRYVRWPAAGAIFPASPHPRRTEWPAERTVRRGRWRRAKQTWSRCSQPACLREGFRLTLGKIEDIK